MSNFPAPWKLKGKGYIVLFKFSKDEIAADKFLGDFFKQNFAGGFASLMIVEYQDSNAGPYNEILLIPGKFRYKSKKKNTISKIFVNTTESVENGIRNWAIPKELADIKFRNTSKLTENISAHLDGKEIFSAEFRKYRLPFPIHTAFLPFPLVQFMNGKAFFTKFTGKGIGFPAKLLNINSDKDYFPDLSSKKIIIAIKIDPFSICFPEAEIIDSGL
jgi:hypothetical protein